MHDEAQVTEAYGGLQLHSTAGKLFIRYIWLLFVASVELCYVWKCFIFLHLAILLRTLWEVETDFI